MKRYKIRKEQLERVVESFVMENNAKKGLNESELLKEGFGDLVSGMKNAISNMSKEIMKMAKKDPQVKADIQKAAEQMGGIKEDASLEDLDNAEELLAEWLTESKGVLTEGVVGKLVGRLMQALGLGGIAVSIPAFISMMPGWSDFTWTTNLNMYMSELCGTYVQYCGPLTLLAVALSIVVAIAGLSKTMRS